MGCYQTEGITFAIITHDYYKLFDSATTKNKLLVHFPVG